MEQTYLLGLERFSDSSFSTRTRSSLSIFTTIGSTCTFDTDGNCSNKPKNFIAETNKHNVMKHTNYKAIVNCKHSLGYDLDGSVSKYSSGDPLAVISNILTKRKIKTLLSDCKVNLAILTTNPRLTDG